MHASLLELLHALEFVSIDGGLGGNSAVLCRETGEIYWQSADSPDISDELPDEIDDDATYVQIPTKRELGLGKPLVLEFVREFLPDAFDEVRDIFGRRGAYAKFRALLERRRAVDRWHSFEERATERALRDWCDDNAIEVVD
jgi:hypothetical protein